MARKNPLNSSDIELAARLLQLRAEPYFTSRAELAYRAGISTGVIKRVELLRSPLRYREGRLIVKYFPNFAAPNMETLNPLWLAFGEGKKFVEWPLLLPGCKEIGLPLSTRFIDFIEQNREVLRGLVQFPPQGYLPEKWLRSYLEECTWLNHVAEQTRGLFGVIESLFLRSAQKLSSGSADAQKALADYNPDADLLDMKKEGLTNINASVNKSAVKLLYQKLRERLKRATSERGMRSALASDMDVPLASISQWLSPDGREPGAERTLQLLAWVERWERKIKKP